MEKWTRIVHTPRLGRRLMALLLCLSMLSSYLPVFALAEESQPVLCEHHPEHDATCGYQEAVAGQDCTHDHGEECYTYQTACLHQHTESCYTTPEPTEEGQAGEPVLNCSHVCSSAPVCLHQHGDECYTEGALTCTHDCSTDVGCVTRVLNCQHQHDATCGYVAAVEAQPCTYHCDICCRPHDDEPASCVCESKCTESSCNQECPVCKDDWNSCEFKEAEVTTSGCICSKTCTEAEKNAECPVCADAPDACEYVEPVCVCQSKCTEELHNSECPVCASAPGSCTYEEPVCNCQSKCTEEAINSDCPVCNSDITGCTYEEPVCNCQSKCTEEAINSECPVCNSDITGCTFVEPVCNCQSKCTEESYNTQCPVCGSDPAACGFTEEQEQSAAVITGWKWIFEEEVLEADTLNELPLNASEEMPAFFEDVVPFLPNQISAALEGQTEPTPLTLNWACPEYPETGAYEGVYTFTAALPTGFSLAEGVEAPSILVTFGGASNLNQPDVAQVSYSHTSSGETTTIPFTSISAAFAKANQMASESGYSCTLYLLDSCTLTENLTVTLPVTRRFTLDFNGKELIFNSGSLIINGGVLALSDTSNSPSPSSIKGTSDTKVIVKNGGCLEVVSGAIYNESGTNGCCVKIEDGGYVDVSGGCLQNDGSGCIIDNSAGTLIVEGGSFSSSNNAKTFSKLTERMLRGGTFDKLTVKDIENSVDLRAALGENRAYFSDSSATTLMKVEAGQKSIDSLVTVGEHSHTFTYTINENQHTATCGCGYTVEEAHTFPTEGATNTCTKCGGFKVSYLDKDGKEKETVAQKLESGSDVTLSPGWYVVTGENVVIENRIEITDTLNLILADGSTLNATKGIHVSENNSLSIYAQSQGERMGALVAQGSTNQAGIGGNQNEKGGTITIHGGHIEATGGNSGAGIGGGDGRNGGTITIHGGHIEATGGNSGAGIGGGNSGPGGVINISGGNIEAKGGELAAGIGGGNGGNGDVIKISGGHITATGNNGGAGIGGGARLHSYTGSGGTVTISGGHITATGNNGGAGIGSGNGGSGGTITIKSGTVTAQSSYRAYSTAPNTAEYSNFKLSVGEKLDSLEPKTYAQRTEEGSGALYTTNKAVVIQPCEETGTAVYQDANNHQVTCEYCNFKSESTNHDFDKYGLCICGAAKYLDENGTENETVAQKLESGSGITLSTGWYVVSPDENSATVEISDRLEIRGSVSLILPDGSTLNANQGIHVPSDATLSIYGQSGQSGQLNAYCSIIDTTDDRVRYAAIGGNDSESYGLLNFNGGKVTAQVGAEGKNVTSAAIGGGYYGANGGTININRGEVTATVIGSESTGAAIGGGNNGLAGSITINGGTVQATISSGNSGGAAIGDGFNVASDTNSVITVNDGFVTATIYGRSEGAAIGGGYAGAEAGNVNIYLNGGTVNATVNGFSEGAAIGGGKNAKVGNIVIDGAIVTATVAAGENQTADVAAIGFGSSGNGGTITIKSGTVTAQSSYRAYSTAPNTQGYSSFKLSVGDALNKLQAKTFAQRTEDTNGALYTARKAVKIEPCNQDYNDLAPIYKDTTCHKVTCDYCGLSYEEVAHTGIENNAGTCSCGYGYYSYWNGEQNVYQLCAPLTQDTATGALSGWYVVKDSVTIDNRIEVGDTLNLILADGYTLTAKQGIYVPSTATLNIYGQSGQSGKLIATAPVNVDNGAIGAAIGGDSIGDSHDCGTLNFNGGIIEATVGGNSSGCAAIGGGEGGSGGTITVNRGYVTANITSGRSNGAAIGGGYNCSGGSIYLNGGEVKATISGGNSFGAAIGGGNNGSAGNINFNGATVTATVTAAVSGGTRQTATGAAIGSGYQGNGGSVTVNSGSVKAYMNATNGGDTFGAAIGHGSEGSGVSVTIHGGTVNAEVNSSSDSDPASESWGAAIGGGRYYTHGPIIIKGGSVTAKVTATGNATAQGAAIGGGFNAACGYIAITGGDNVTATVTGNSSAVFGAAIGGGGSIGNGGTFIQLVPNEKVVASTTANPSQSYGISTPTSGIRPTGTANEYEVYGDLTVQSGITIPSGAILVIPEGTVLTTNNKVTNDGMVIVDGTLNGKISGNVYYQLTLTNATPDKTLVEHDGKNYALVGDKITLTPTLGNGEMVKSWKVTPEGAVSIDQNKQFTMCARAISIKPEIAEIVATVSCGDVTTNYATIGEALAAANSAAGSTLKLMKDVTVGEPLRVTGSFTLDLNGKTLENIDTIQANPRHAIQIVSACTLTIIDSSANQGGSVVGADAYAIQNANGNLLLGNNSDYSNLNITIKGIANNGNLYIYSGKVTSDNAVAVSNLGGHVEVYGNAVLSGTVCISNNDSEVKKGTVDIYGGEFQTGNLTFNGNVGGVKLCGDSILFKAKNSRDIAIPWDCGVKLEHILADGHAYFSRKTTEDTTSDEIIKIGDATGIATAPGFVVVKSHTCPNPTYTYVNKDNHTTFCNECGVTRTVKHTFIDDSGESPVYSEGTCPCGAAKIKYLAYDATKNAVVEVTDPVFCAPVTQNMTDGWYVVSQNVEFEKRLNVNGDVHLILMDNTTLTAKEGIHVSESNSLSIYAQSVGDTMGALDAAHLGNVAAIGGNINETGGAITIHGGKITANGGPSCAGIGGGVGGAGGNITIYGGDITANGGNTAAGIGGGENGAGGNITIYGGKIIASCRYDDGDYANYGAGIGGGYQGAGGSITIHGGDITATGGYEAAGIGGGAGCKSGDTVVSPSGGTINISGGNIEANGGQSGGGIGGGRYGAGGTINISGGEITATGGRCGAGIGGGDQGAGGNISISGNAKVTATSGGYGAGIGGGNKGAGVSITISGGKITANGGFEAAGIGGGAGYENSKPSAGTINISGGKITAKGGVQGAGIGGGKGGSGGTINISDGDIEATGGNYGAGVGCGDLGAGVEIAISGGKITATSVKYGAGIGGGGGDLSSGESVSNVKISISGNAEVTATSGGYGAGIGGGQYGDGGTIEISGGTITADGGLRAAGIGSGHGYDIKVTSGGNIQISGGTVEARGGGYAAGIGGGYYGNGGNVTISGNANVTATSGNADDSQDKIPAGIGSGAYPINDSSVTITGGTVTINDGTVTALSTGDGTAFSVNPTLGANVNWKVSTGESAEKLTPVTFAARTAENYTGYTTSKAAKIELCNHQYAPVYENQDSHKLCCVWCDVLKQESVPHGFTDTICPCGAAYIQYQAYVNGSMQQQNAQFCAPVTQNMTDGWYVVSRDMEFDTRLTVNGDVHLILMDNTTLTAKEGIEVTAGNSLSIYAQSEGDTKGKLIAGGSLDVDEYEYYDIAGIGGNDQEAGGTITIHGGNVTANGGWYAAGIGGGSGGDGGSITIFGGDIEARGGTYDGAGIGGGSGGDGGTITIHGGNVTAYGGWYAAGIGGGSGGDGGNITISGGVIDAIGGYDGAGIGGGYEGEGGTITISGGTVYAGGGDENGAGIGGGYKGAGGNITITGGDIEAYGGDENGAGIGSGAGDDEVIKPSGGTITISGGTVYAKGYSNGAGIGGGELCAGGTITISGGDIEAKSEGDGAGIGGGDKGAGGTITISGGHIVAKSKYDGAGIGGGKQGAGGNITITGGDITAYSRRNGAGIGGGKQGAGGSFSTGESGKAVIFASSIQNQSGAGSWKGTIFQGSEGKVCGDQTLTASVTLSSGYSLLVPEGVTLNAGDYLTNDGEIYVDGILNGNVTGSIYYPITAEGITVSGAETFGEKIYALKDSTITLTPPGPDGDYVFKQWLIENEPVANNQFRMPAKPVTIIVNWEPAVSIDSYTSSCVTSYDQSAKLSVTIRKAPAATADVTYQWYLNDKPISGAVQSSYTTPSDLNAGEYTYECTITCGSASVSQKIPVTVKKIGRGITFSAPNKTYDGQPVAISGINYPGNGTAAIHFKPQGASDSSYTTTAPVSAGSYTVRVSVTEGTNHKEAWAVRDFTIAPKPVTVTITPNGGTYGGTITPASAALVGVVAGEKVEVTLTYNGSAQVPTKAGSYTVTASISDGNYQLTGTTAAEFVIQKATVKTPTVASKDYNGKNQTADIQDTDLYTVTKNQGGVEIGNYDVVLTLKDPSNYQWDENGGKTTFQIVKAGSNTWTTQPDIGGWTYGDAPSTPTAEARYGTVLVDYTADGKTYSEAVPTQAGTYKARFTVAETDRYSGLEMHKSFTISKRPVTVTITPNGGTYSGTITPASAALAGVVAGEKVDVSLTYNGSTQVPTKAGSYTVTASISDGNYQLTGTTTAEFVIQKATVKTPAVASKDYNGKNQTADIQDTDLYTVTKNEGGVEIGSYEVVLTLKDSANYQWDANGGVLTFEIIKAGSNTWTTQPAIDDWTYGDAPSTPTAAARYGTVKVDYTADGKTYTEAVPTQAGTYKARFTVAETGDHNGLEMEKEFTIAKRPVTVSGIKAESKTYDAGTAAKLNLTEAVLNGKLASDDLTFTASGTFKDARAGQGKTVTISVTLGGKSAANYAVTGSLTAKADIARKELTLLRVRIADKQYDGLNTASFYMPPVLSGVCGNDQVILVSGVPTFETVEVGTGIKVNVTPFDLHGPDSMNYTLIQPTGLTGNIVNNYHPEAGLDYTTTGGQWSNQNFVITAKEGNTLSTGNTADGTWKNELTVSQEGEGELTFYVRDDSTGAISNPVTVSFMVDKTAPTGSILFDGADVTDRGDGRSIYKNADVKVTITGSDALSGVAELAYYQSNAVLNHAQVEAVTEWTAGNGFTLKAENGASCVVYGKVTDKAGNVAYFRSFQLLFDTDAPGLSGIVDGATYYTTQIVHVDDEALQSLTLNGENVTSPVTLPGNTDGTYTITATDKAGNSTTCTVTMKKISSLYEQVADINSENVGKSDKASLETAKSALEALPVSPVEAENREIQDALSNINAALKALENAAEVQRQIDSLPDTAKPGDTAAKEEVNRVRENYDKLTEHEKSLVETKKLEELEDALGFHGIVEGAGSVWFKGSGKKLTFKANGSMEGFTGVKLDGKLITAFTTDPGSNAVALEPALLQGLTLGEHKIRFVYADGETRDAVFTVKVSPNYLDLEGKDEFNSCTEVWVDGVAYPVETVGGRYVNLPDSGSLLTIYTYQQGNSNGSHDNYPTGMKVYRIERTQNGATVEHLAALDDLLQYSGCSIRVNGKQGIRMITSLTQQNKDALTSTGLAGFTLEEYGTVVSWVKELGNASLTLDNGRHNYAYKKDVADPIFAASGGLTQYTNVLVGFNLEQCKDDIVMRPYIVLKDADGQLVTLYGGTVTRSIGYIACQNRNTFQPGSAAYQYVWEIIHSAYGDQFDSEYQG